MRKSLLVFAALLLSLFAAAQQNHWNRESETALRKDVFAKKQRPSNFLVFRLQEKAMEAQLRNAPSEKNISAKRSSFILSVPDENGTLMQFSIVEASVIHSDLKAKYPRIRSYSGRSLTEPGTSIRFSFTPQGFNGVILFADKPAVYIEKLEKGNNLYMVISQKDLPAVKDFECFTKDIRQQSKLQAKSSGSFGTLDADDGNLRAFRLAFAASAEFSQWCLTGEEANDDERRATVLAEQSAQLTIVNGHMERDFGVRMEIIGNNTDIIYLDAASDPFTGGDPDSDVINAESQTAITTEIGSDNFDIGHLIRLSSGSGSFGNAGAIGAVCQDAIKARGFTSRPDWNATGVYSEIMLTHEFGHQMGANHTFTHKDDNDNAQMEPGSGSTIMSYGGNVDGYNVVSRRDHYFHAISIQQATAYIGSAGCGNTVSANNTAPAADAGSNYTIPKSTPFKLTGTGSDADGEDELTFNWEQMDKLTEDADFPRAPSTTNTNGPVFRSRLPSGNNFRIFPILENILDGSNTNTWEKLPSVQRDLNFRFTVRDNNPGAGQNNSDNMVVTVDGDLGPFQVTSPNSEVTWCPGTHTVTWDVNGSDELAANVKISLSTDGGQTFSTLVASTANDGSAEVTIACAYSNTARIKVEAVGNIFFDISNTNFTVGDNQKPTFTVPADIIIEKDANCNYDATVGVTGDVTDEADNCSTSLNATYADVIAAGSCVGETIITRTWTLIDGCNLKTEKIQTITIKDVTAPTFTVPADITIYKDENCEHNDDPSVTGNPTDVDDNCDPTPDVTYSDVDAPGSCMGEVIITRTWKVTDDCGNKTEKIQIITVKDTIPPTISNISASPEYLWPPNHKMVQVTISYDVADNCSDQAHITKQLSIVSNEPINGLGDGDTEPIDYEVSETDPHHTVWLRAERAGNGDGRIYTIYITATDDCGNSTTDSTKVYVVHNITGPSSGKPFKIGSTVTMNGEFWDVPGNKHTAKWILDESTIAAATVTEPVGSRKGLVSGSYKFNTAGVYKVKMSITDQNGFNSYATTNGDQEQIIVIYDPEGGHTFGGGWYQSPAGALKSDASATGKATFGFAANYFKKSTNPKGETQFVFKVGDFEYNAVNFEYLALNNNTAQIKGNGRITGLQSGISFIMTVLDGAVTGGEDKIRMKIYNKNTGEVYYDNQPGASDADLPTMTVGANSTIVVQGKPAHREENMPVTIAANKLDARPMPNPTSTYFTLHVTGNNNEKINVTVFDLYGRIMETHVTPNGSYIRFGENYKAGTYFVKVSQGELSKQVKLIKTK